MNDLVQRVAILALLVCALFGASSANGGKVESIGAFTDQAASDSVRGALEPAGYRVTAADGSVICEVWLRKGVPPAQKADVQGAIYPIADSALVGVISFPKQTTDFRGQSIKPGLYTLRYAVHPNDGNHLGISPNRDFLLMVPVSVDKDASAQMKFEDLVKMSKNASGTNHPAGLSLVSTEGKKDFPSVAQDDNNRTILVAKAKNAAGADLPIALIVKGVAE
jgi:hypothetical protein